MTYILELFPVTRNLVFSSGIAYIDDKRRLLHDYHWNELLRSWLLSTIAYQLWFLRVLFFYNLIYPALRWCVLNRFAKWPFWLVVAILWVGTVENILVDGEGLLFFSLGIWIQKTNFPLETTVHHRRNALVWGILFLAFAAVTTGLAFVGQASLGNRVFLIIALLHKFTVASGLLAAWFGSDRLIRWCMAKKRFTRLSVFSFFIYVFHTPLAAYAINPMLSWLHPLPAYRLLVFILVPLSVLTCCIGLASLFQRIAPGVCGAVTGGRGIG
jgi:hypothetical protein